MWIFLYVNGVALSSINKIKLFCTCRRHIFAFNHRILEKATGTVPPGLGICIHFLPIQNQHFEMNADQGLKVKIHVKKHF